MERLNIVNIGGTDVPLKCDNYVLAQLQEKYKTLNNFEMKLLGLSIIEIDGKVQKDKDGKTMFLKGEPSVQAINDALPLMIEEGFAYAADLGRKMEPINTKLFMRELNMDYRELSVLIHDEFTRAFSTKN